MIFPYLEAEASVQIKDRTRLSAVKTFVSKGGAALTTLTLKPGANGSAQNIFDAVVSNRYLDWEFSTFEMDVDSVNNKINFTEGSGSELTATLANGTYTLAQLATEIALQMNAVGTQVYTVAYDSDDKITISAPTEFALLYKTGTNEQTSMLPHIGFDEDQEGTTSYEGERTEYGIKQITVIGGDGTTTATTVGYVKIFSVAGDMLFSSDSDLMVHEPDILKFVKQGRNTHKDVHRRAQGLVFDFLDQQQMADDAGEPIGKEHLATVDEVKDWATFIALRLIFEGNSNHTDDVFGSKAKYYESKEISRRNVWLKLDLNKDGVASEGERLNINSARLIRE